MFPFLFFDRTFLSCFQTYKMTFGLDLILWTVLSVFYIFWNICSPGLPRRVIDKSKLKLNVKTCVHGNLEFPMTALLVKCTGSKKKILQFRTVFSWVSEHENRSYRSEHALSYSVKSQTTQTTHWTNQNPKQTSMRERVTIGFLLTSDCMTEWANHYRYVGDAKLKQIRVDTAIF